MSTKPGELHSAVYGYDSLGQVTSAEYTNVALPTESYSYDALGNRLVTHLSTGHIHNAANQLIEDDHFTYAYDNNGNMIAKVDKATSDSTEYIYNYKNRMTGIREYAGGVTLSMQADYSYDGVGRRIGKYVDSDTTTYAYDGNNFVKEYDASATVIASYSYGLGIDQPLKVTRSGADYYFHTDRLGTVKALTDDLGYLSQAYEYDAFGNILSTLSANYHSPYSFTGREYDSESGLFYYRARYYDQVSGRFMGKDPQGFRDHFNPYLYVTNNPLNLVDPSGEVFSLITLGYIYGPAIATATYYASIAAYSYFTKPAVKFLVDEGVALVIGSGAPALPGNLYEAGKSILDNREGLRNEAQKARRAYQKADIRGLYLSTFDPLGSSQNSSNTLPQLSRDRNRDSRDLLDQLYRDRNKNESERLSNKIADDLCIRR